MGLWSFLTGDDYFSLFTSGKFFSLLGESIALIDSSGLPYHRAKHVTEARPTGVFHHVMLIGSRMDT